jgi:chromatin structure-remodeling complex subunit RSC1/2
MGITAAQKKAIEEVLTALTSLTGSPRKRQLAGMFLDLVDRVDWPEYYEVIPEPRCLNGIQTMLEKNKYKDPLDAYTDLSLVFLNALFYNEPDSQIAMDAQTLKVSHLTRRRSENAKIIHITSVCWSSWS